MPRVIAALVLSGCSDKKASEPPAGDARVATGDRPAAPDAAPVTENKPVDAAAAKSVEPLELSVAEQCETPCLLLARHRFASISEGAYCETCKAIKPRACELVWPPIDDEPSCDDWDQWRHCLLAAHGFRFRRAKLRRQFRRERWYTPRRRVRPEHLTGVARANLEYLETRARACREALAAQAGRTIARLRGDFDGNGRKRPAVVTDSQVKIGRDRVDHGIAPSDAMSAIEATLIDIDSGDRAVEILVALHAGDSAASRYVVVYVEGEVNKRRRRRGRKGPLAISEVIETFGAVEATGDGALEIRDQVCGQIREVAYGYRDGKLVKTKDETDGERDPARCD